MMGKRRVGDLEFPLNLIDHEPLGMRRQQQLHDAQPGLGGYGREHVGIFGNALGGLLGSNWFCGSHCHVSILPEIWSMSSGPRGPKESKSRVAADASSAAPAITLW